MLVSIIFFILQINSLSTNYLRKEQGIDLIHLDKLNINIHNNKIFTNVNNANNANTLLVENDHNISLFQSIITNDELIGNCWALKKETGGIDLLNAWTKFSCIDSNIYKIPIVAVFDTGIQTNHPDLQNVLWINEKEKYGIPGVDDDGNGYIDDINGFNFISNSGNIEDDHYHGTHVAGIIAANSNNQFGTSGVFWKSRLMILKIMNNKGQGLFSAALQGLNYAVKMGAIITSHSWGGNEYSQILLQALQVGNLFHVMAAGNDGKNTDIQPVYPGSFFKVLGNAISVGATDENGKITSFSNYGINTVGIAAPGSNIVSTCPNSKFCVLSGTSQATPFTTGIIAMSLYFNEMLLNNKKKSIDIRKLLLSSIRPESSLQNKIQSGGIISAALVIENLLKL